MCDPLRRDATRKDQKRPCLCAYLCAVNQRIVACVEMARTIALG